MTRALFPFRLSLSRLPPGGVGQRLKVAGRGDLVGVARSELLESAWQPRELALESLSHLVQIRVGRRYLSVSHDLM